MDIESLWTEDYQSKKGGDFAKFLWPSQNIWTLMKNLPILTYFVFWWGQFYWLYTTCSIYEWFIHDQDYNISWHRPSFKTIWFIWFFHCLNLFASIILVMYISCTSNNLKESKACNESWVQQLTPFDSWTLTARTLLIKVLFSVNKRTRLWL